MSCLSIQHCCESSKTSLTRCLQAVFNVVLTLNDVHLLSLFIFAASKYCQHTQQHATNLNQYLYLYQNTFKYDGENIEVTHEMLSTI